MRSPKRTQRALDKAGRFVERLNQLRDDLTSARNEPDRERALEDIEALVLIRSGSSELDHRKQLALSGLQAAFEAYLAPDAPRAAVYAASVDQDALLAEEALCELRDEYPDEAAQLTVADVAASVRQWAERFSKST